MTMPHEEQQALEWAETFLLDVLHKKYRTNEHMRKIAAIILRHYPGKVRIEMLYRTRAAGGV
jgi:hypothetical protein